MLPIIQNLERKYGKLNQVTFQHCDKEFLVYSILLQASSPQNIVLLMSYLGNLNL
jgi:hypothetical protein